MPSYNKNVKTQYMEYRGVLCIVVALGQSPRVSVSQVVGGKDTSQPKGNILTYIKKNFFLALNAGAVN